MTIHIMSAGSKTNLSTVENKFKNLTSCANTNAYINIWPEVCGRPKHPAKLHEEILSKVTEAIESSNDVYILTFNDTVFNAIRIAVARNKVEDAILHAVNPDGSINMTKMLSDGCLQSWFSGVFDTWDNQLDEILDLRSK